MLLECAYVQKPDTSGSHIKTLDLDGTLISGKLLVPSPLVDVVEAVLFSLGKHDKNHLSQSTRNLIIAMMRYLANKRTLSLENRRSLGRLYTHSREKKSQLAVLSGRQSYLRDDTLQHLDNLQIRTLFDRVYLNIGDLLSAEYKAGVATQLGEEFEFMVHIEDDIRAAIAMCEANPQLICYLLNSLINDYLGFWLFRTLPSNLRFADSFPQAVEMIVGGEREKSRYWAAGVTL